MSLFYRPGIVNVRMVITEEKILSNIDKVQKIINPNSKKQIIQLDEDTYFKDLIESIKMYLIEYPKKKNFPKSVYKAAYGLVEYATNQFEENTKQIEEIDMERIEDRSKALSYIGIEIAEALKGIPTPIDDEPEKVETPVEVDTDNYIAETRVEVKPTLWERIKQSKIGKAVSCLFKIRIRIDMSNALPEGRGEH